MNVNQRPRHAELRLRIVESDPHALPRVMSGLHAAGIRIRALQYSAGRLLLTVDARDEERVRRRLSRMVSVADVQD